jgi:hypothetical protein
MHDDWSEIDFARVTSCAASSQVRAVTVQMSALGDEGNTNEGERGENVEVLQPLGLMAVPSITQTTEAPFLRIGDRQVALGIIDKGATPQAVEAGEVRLYGPGSSNATATVRIRADGSIEITAKSGVNISLAVDGAGDVVLDGGSWKVARATDPVTIDSVLATWIGQVTTAVNALAPGAVTAVPGSTVGTITASAGAAHVKA